MTTKPTYPQIEDVLDYGVHKIKVYKKPEFGEDKQPIKGSHKHGTSPKGSDWWMYQTKIVDKYYNLFANTKNKAQFDTGTIQLEIKKQFDKNTGVAVKRHRVVDAPVAPSAPKQDNTEILNRLDNLELRMDKMEKTPRDTKFTMPEASEDPGIDIKTLPF